MKGGVKMTDGSIKIDTVPLPERPILIEIPVKLLREFEEEARVVIRHPWVVGLPLPEIMLRKLLKDPNDFKDLTEKFDIMLIPR